jgi:iron complex outermembrane receptor protein
MSTKTFKKGVLASSIALIIAGGISSQAMAADEVNSADKEIEVIQVTGIRGSMKENINAKRFSNSVVDVITSEDIGKFPDKNVAESLSRVTGVSVSREFGEGEKISIRGAGPKYNRTLMNGQTVASADWFILDEASRSFNYTLLPSVIVKGLEVYKSPTADLDEGSIGGTVILKTRRPLDMDANTISASVEAQYSDKSGETDPLVDAMYSWKNENENFGILVSGVQQNRSVERQGFEVLGYTDFTAADGQDYILPTVMGAPIFKQDRERSTYFATLQYAPTDSLLFTFNAMTSEMDSNNQNANLLAWVNNQQAAVDNQTSLSPGGAVLATSDAGGQIGYDYINRISSTKTNQFHLDVDYETDAFTLNFEVGTTAAEGGTTRETSWEYVTKAVDTNGYNYDLNGVPNLDFINTTGTTASDFEAGWIWGGSKPTTDEENFAQVDFDIPVEMGMITSIKTGVKYRGAKREQGRMAFSWHGPKEITGGGPDSDNYLDHIFDTCPTLADCGLTDSGNVTLDSVATGDVTEQLAHNRDSFEEIAFVGLNGVDAGYAISENLPEIWAVEEDNLAVYVDASFEGDNFRGNFGVRYVQTDQASSGYEFSANSWGFNTINGDWLKPDTLEWVTTDNDYSEFLPSFNLTYNISDEQLVRFAAARVMSRQNWSDISASETFGSLNTTDPQGTRGNPLLDPTIANQFDVSYEWYYSDASMLSAALFFKDLDSIATKTTVTEDRYNEETEVMVPVDFNMSVNGPGGTIAGIELGLQHDFGGFGIQANYTYTDASADGERDLDVAGSGLIDGVSDHMANLVGYYENDNFGARLMYNYRSDWYKGLHHSGMELYNESFGQLDASFSYNATENVTVTLEAVNISDTEIKEYNIEKSRMVSIYQNGRRFVAGVRVNF